jgi:hypothetical protein
MYKENLKMFKTVQVTDVPLPPTYFKPWTENYLVLLEEIAERFPPAAEAAPNIPFTKEAYLEMFEKVLEEVKNGVVLNSKDIIAVVAQL